MTLPEITDAEKEDNFKNGGEVKRLKERGLALRHCVKNPTLFYPPFLYMSPIPELHCFQFTWHVTVYPTNSVYNNKYAKEPRSCSE